MLNCHTPARRAPFIRLTFASALTRRTMPYFYLHRHLGCTPPGRIHPAAAASDCRTLPRPVLPHFPSARIVATYAPVVRGPKFLLSQCSKVLHRTLKYPFKMPIKDGTFLRQGEIIYRNKCAFELICDTSDDARHR